MSDNCGYIIPKHAHGLSVWVSELDLLERSMTWGDRAAELGVRLDGLDVLEPRQPIDQAVECRIIIDRSCRNAAWMQAFAGLDILQQCSLEEFVKWQRAGRRDR